jgi:hypothetical protein
MSSRPNTTTAPRDEGGARAGLIPHTDRTAAPALSRRAQCVRESVASFGDPYLILP